MVEENRSRLPYTFVAFSVALNAGLMNNFFLFLRTINSYEDMDAYAT